MTFEYSCGTRFFGSEKPAQKHVACAARSEPVAVSLKRSELEKESNKKLLVETISY